MFRQVRYQTGELDDVIKEMEIGNIPCMDVDDSDEFDWVVVQLSKRGMYLVESVPFDRNARDKIKEAEFEYRVTFSKISPQHNSFMYIDFYFEPDIEETYDSILGD